MSGQKGFSNRRRLKKEVRMRKTAQEILEQTVALLRANGYAIHFPEQIPEILQQAFGPAKLHTAPTLAPPMGLEETLDDDMDGLFDDEIIENLEFPVIDMTGSSTPPSRMLAEHLPDLSGDLLEEYQRRQRAMIERIETEGVHYRNSPGPAEGRTLTADPSVRPRTAPAPSPAPVRGSPAGPRAAARGPNEPTATVENNGERVNPHTGLTPTEARQKLERALGRSFPPPSAGAPNTLKP